MRPPYSVLAAAAVASIPDELRGFVEGRPLLPGFPARVAGRAASLVVAGILGRSPAASAAAQRTTREDRAVRIT
jgi:hypothetical protein